MSRNKPARILVVDDEQNLRDILTYDLQKAGYSIVEAANGKEAFDIVRKEELDLVLSDVRMPSGTGLELLDWIRSVKPGEPAFLFMTAFADVSSDEALDLGAQAFLRKPIEKSELLEEVAKALVPRAERWAAPAPEFEGARRLELPAGDVLTGVEAVPPEVLIGQGGMFVELTGNWPACYEVVEFEVPYAALKTGRLVGHGCVRWVRREPVGALRTGIGIEFLSLTSDSRADLFDYLSKARPKAYVPLKAGNFA